MPLWPGRISWARRIDFPLPTKTGFFHKVGVIEEGHPIHGADIINNTQYTQGEGHDGTQARYEVYRKRDLRRVGARAHRQPGAHPVA